MTRICTPDISVNYNAKNKSLLIMMMIMKIMIIIFIRLTILVIKAMQYCCELQKHSQYLNWRAFVTGKGVALQQCMEAVENLPWLSPAKPKTS